MDEKSFLARLDQPRLAQRLQVLRRVRQRQARLRRQRVDASLPLRQQLQQFQPVRIADGFTHACELRVEAVLELSIPGVHLH